MMYPKLLDVRKKDGYHAVHYAAASGVFECFKKVLKYSCIENDTKEEQFLLNYFTDDGQTILHVACIKGKTELCEHLMMSYPKLLDVREEDRYHVIH